VTAQGIDYRDCDQRSFISSRRWFFAFILSRMPFARLFALR